MKLTTLDSIQALINSMNEIGKSKLMPKEGLPIIVWTGRNFIPAMYLNGEFVKVERTDQGYMPYVGISSVLAWAYELGSIEEPEDDSDSEREDIAKCRIAALGSPRFSTNPIFSRKLGILLADNQCQVQQVGGEDCVVIPTEAFMQIAAEIMRKQLMRKLEEVSPEQLLTTFLAI
jgi:hypothetical protein